jgi:uncharacterized protein
MSLTLKDCVNPWKAADTLVQISGRLPVKHLGRLTEAVLENSDDVEVSLEFERSEDHLPVMKGTIKATLKLECQRCLEPMDLPVEHEFCIAFIHAGRLQKQGDTADSQISDRYDLYEVEDENLCLIDVIEDELLLLLPQVPMHNAPACVIKTEFGDDAEQAPREEKENPFAVLASLKDKLNS